MGHFSPEKRALFSLLKKVEGHMPPLLPPPGSAAPASFYCGSPIKSVLTGTHALYVSYTCYPLQLKYFNNIYQPIYNNI
jgi:hypothetical protein